MKTNVRKNVPAERVKETLPLRFQPVLGALPHEVKLFTLLIFAGDQVLVSTAIEKALKKLDFVPNQLLVFGYNFTEEAINLLNAHGVYIYSLRDWHWTDESYKKVTQRR